MSSRSLGLLIWVMAAVVMGIAITATRTEVEPIPDMRFAHPADAEPGLLLSDERSASILSGLSADPFFRNHAGDQLVESEVVDDVHEPAVIEAIDQLRVAGIVGGPPWHAVLSGGPLVSRAVVVGTGDSIADMLVLDVGQDSVRIQGTAGVRVLMLDSRR